MQHESRQPIRRAAGGVVYCYDAAGQPLILLIHDKYGSWTLPKGHLHTGESEQAAAVREVLEETGIPARAGPLVARIGYLVSKHGLPRDKQVAFFLMRATEHTTSAQAEEGISAAEWFAPSSALALIGYPQVRQVLEQALQLLAEQRPAE
jgi:8-oxo-dGTP pyrophosphatase MutT (NUDIX family)